MKRFLSASLALFLASNLVSCVPLVAGGAFLYAAGSDRYTQDKVEPSEDPHYRSDGGWGQFQDSEPQP